MLINSLVLLMPHDRYCCNPKQQAKIASYCKEFFGDKMLAAPLDDHPLMPNVQLPSPEQLKEKILIKNSENITSFNQGENSTSRSLCKSLDEAPEAVHYVNPHLRLIKVPPPCNQPIFINWFSQVSIEVASSGGS